MRWPCLFVVVVVVIDYSQMLNAVAMFSLLEVESSSCRVLLTSTRPLSGPSASEAPCSSPTHTPVCPVGGGTDPPVSMDPVSTTLTPPQGRTSPHPPPP